MTKLEHPCQFPTSPPITLGTGRLCWPRAERITGRYGLVTLTDATSPITPASITPCIDLSGSLTAVILTPRPSTHPGDFPKRLRPHTPLRNQSILLGTGTLFTDTIPSATSTILCIGLKPNDNRADDWLDPTALYNAVDQTVELIFNPTEPP